MARQSSSLPGGKVPSLKITNELVGSKMESFDSDNSSSSPIDRSLLQQKRSSMGKLIALKRAKYESADVPEDLAMNEEHRGLTTDMLGLPTLKQMQMSSSTDIVVAAGLSLGALEGLSSGSLVSSSGGGGGVVGGVGMKMGERERLLEIELLNVNYYKTVGNQKVVNSLDEISGLW